MALKDLASSFNIKGKLEFNTSDNNVADLKDLEFKNKLIEYNKQDCLALFNIIIKFKNEIYDLFGITIKNIPTLSSLA
jgi:hypothetical protein